MLSELVVTNLGVIERAELTLEAGMTALTGETGAGKTLVVAAIGLLLGGRADGGLVGVHDDQARVDGRFESPDGTEIVVSRVVTRGGRSRGYVDGTPATAARLAELGRGLVDLYGQHAHQSLLGSAAQRHALDDHAGTDPGELDAIDAELRDARRQLLQVGGDERARARELDLVRHQLDEIERAGIDDPDEEDALVRAEAELADATAHREHGTAAHDGLVADTGAVDAVRAVVATLGGREPFAEHAARLQGLLAELDDVASELRGTTEGIIDDPEALEAVRARRRELRELRRKYGDTLADVASFADDQRRRLAELEGHDERAARLDARLAELVGRRATAAGRLLDRRRAAAPELAGAVAARFARLALGGARLEIDVAGEAGEDVTFCFDANDGPVSRPLSKVASGGELARVMLALRLELSPGPPTLVFDEVDAGIGGSAAVAVGASLAGLAERHQVLVVTHLAQVAAHADAHLVVDKVARETTVSSQVRRVEGDERLVELGRMLSGDGGGETATAHAAELVERARRRRGEAA